MKLFMIEITSSEIFHEYNHYFCIYNVNNLNKLNNINDSMINILNKINELIFVPYNYISMNDINNNMSISNKILNNIDLMLNIFKSSFEHIYIYDNNYNDIIDDEYEEECIDDNNNNNINNINTPDNELNKYKIHINNYITRIKNTKHLSDNDNDIFEFTNHGYLIYGDFITVDIINDIYTIITSYNSWRNEK